MLTTTDAAGTVKVMLRYPQKGHQQMMKSLWILERNKHVTQLLIRLLHVGNIVQAMARIPFSPDLLSQPANQELPGRCCYIRCTGSIIEAFYRSGLREFTRLVVWLILPILVVGRQAITILVRIHRADDFGGGAFIGGVGKMSACGKSLCGVLGGCVRNCITE